MKSTNTPSGAIRYGEAGLPWEEVRTPGTPGLTTHMLPMEYSIRVSVGATSPNNCTITCDGILAMTLRPGETEVINVGSGIENGVDEVKVEIDGGAPGDVSAQVCVEVELGRFQV